MNNSVNKIIVSKFGGTSMGNAACMLRSAEVSLKQKSSVVVVSATSGTTNDLIELGKTSQAKPWPEAEIILNKIRQRHIKIAEDLKLSSEFGLQLSSLFEEMESLGRGIHLLKDCSVKALDALMSLGERMSSVLFTAATQQVLQKYNSSKRAELFDVRKVLRTDENFSKARPLTSEIKTLCKTHLGHIHSLETIVVTQGFIGRTEDGMTTTLGRGGSDYSAAILAEGIGAD
ncbi:MAG TPA: lysine-sensitive aspartokinase 3, partial [Pseudobdellovibrionaceae bacterium]